MPEFKFPRGHMDSWSVSGGAGITRVSKHRELLSTAILPGAD